VINYFVRIQAPGNLPAEKEAPGAVFCRLFLIILIFLESG
jgi:hypothetical protein